LLVNSNVVPSSSDSCQPEDACATSHRYIGSYKSHTL
jgi:hypothetical protein